MPGGRPSKYDPAMCDQVLAWGEEGKSKTWMAAKLGISRQRLYDWEAEHEEFRDALTRAQALSQMWWEDAGQAGMYVQGFNAGVYNKQISNRFPEDHRDQTKVELAGSIGLNHKQITDVSDEELFAVIKTGGSN